MCAGCQHKLGGASLAACPSRLPTAFRARAAVCFRTVSRCSHEWQALLTVPSRFRAKAALIASCSKLLRFVIRRPSAFITKLETTPPLMHPQWLLQLMLQPQLHSTLLCLPRSHCSHTIVLLVIAPLGHIVQHVADAHGMPSHGVTKPGPGLVVLRWLYDDSNY